MQLFIWNNVDHASDRYHDDGGVIVIAETLEHARAMLDGYGDREAPCEAMTKEPDLVRECVGPEYIAIHPNAGCC
jgi:hypothetical protein